MNVRLAVACLVLAAGHWLGAGPAEALDEISIRTPAESRISPAWVEGLVSAQIGGPVIVTSGESGSQTTVREADGRWRVVSAAPGGPAGILLPADGSALPIVAHIDRNGTSVTATQSLRWTATRIDAEEAVSVPVGASLRLTAGTAGTGASLAIDSDGNGTPDLQGAPGAVFAVPFPTAGEVRVTASIDGAAAESLLVRAVAVTMAGAARITDPSFVQAELTEIAPPSAAEQVFLRGSQERLAKPKGRQDRSYYIQAYRNGTCAIEARLGGEFGPILARQDVTIEMNPYVTLVHQIFVIKQFADSESLTMGSVRIHPWIPARNITVEIWAGGTTMEDGQRIQTFSTTAADQTGRINFFMISPPEAGSACIRCRLEP